MVAFSLSCWVLLLSLFPVKIVIVMPGASKVVITLARNKHLASTLFRATNQLQDESLTAASTAEIVRSFICVKISQTVRDSAVAPANYATGSAPSLLKNIARN